MSVRHVAAVATAVMLGTALISPGSRTLDHSLDQRLVAVAARTDARAIQPAEATRAQTTLTARRKHPHRVGFSPGWSILELAPADQRAELEGMRRLGARMVRLDVSWSSVQADGPSSYDWSTTDRAIQTARSVGLRVLAVIGYEPDWASGEDGRGNPAPPDPNLFATFAAAAAAHYGDQVSAWEIWNEPNLRGAWPTSPDPADYARLVEAAAPALHAGDPGSTVMVGSLAPAGGPDPDEYPPTGFLAGIYQNLDGPAPFDAVSVHPYTYPASPFGRQSWNLFAELPALRQVMVDAGDGDARLWLTEYGAPTGDSDRSVTPRRQARLLGAAYHAWRHLDGVGPLFFYSYQDQGSDPANTEDNFGVITADGTHKPAYSTLRRLFRRHHGGQGHGIRHVRG